MDLVAAEVLSILMRWMHIASMALLVGGAAFLRFVALPAVDDSPDAGELAERFAAGFRPLVYAAVVGVIGSGLFNFLARPGHTRFYYMLFGVKMLLAAHVFVSALLMGRAGVPEPKVFRRASSIVISGVLIILLSAYLRRIF